MASGNIVVRFALIRMLIDQVLIDIILHIAHKIYGKLVSRNFFFYWFSLNRTCSIFVECQFCGKRYSRKDSLKHHMKTQHAEFFMSNCTWKDKNNSSYHRSNELIYQSNTNKLSSNLLGIQSNSSSSNEKEQMENDDIVLVN